MTIAIASFSLGPAMEQDFVVQKPEFYAPALGQLFGANIDGIVRARGPASIVALVGLSWSAPTVFYTLTLNLNELWGVERRRPVWKRRGLAMLFVLAFVGSTLFLSFVSTYISMSNLVYGSVAAIIAFLAWAYLSSLIFILGAYLSVSYYRLKRQQREAAGPNTSRLLRS